MYGGFAAQAALWRDAALAAGASELATHSPDLFSDEDWLPTRVKEMDKIRIYAPAQ